MQPKAVAWDGAWGSQGTCGCRQWWFGQKGPALPWRGTEVWRGVSRRTVQGQVGLVEAPRVPALCCSWRGHRWTWRPTGAERA